MSFQDFITTIYNSFNTFFTHITNYISLLINNNFIKLIIYFSIFSFITYFLFEIIKLFLKIINNGHNKETKIEKKEKNNIE